jgi:hypothetical protein
VLAISLSMATPVPVGCAGAEVVLRFRLRSHKVMAKKFHAIQRAGGKFKVVAKSTGKTLGTHPSRAEALAQLRAVEFSKHNPGEK